MEEASSASSPPATIAAAPGDEAPAAAAPVVGLWTCDICKCTISTRGDGRAEAAHQNGKPHMKKLRALGLAPPVETVTKRKHEEVMAAVGVDPSVRCADASGNCKSVLNEMCQQRKWNIRYEIVSIGEAHQPAFTATAVLERGRGFAQERHVGASATNKRAAEVAAAAVVLCALNDLGVAMYNPEENVHKGNSRSHVRWLLQQQHSTDELLNLVGTWRHVVQPDALACAWNRLAHMSRAPGSRPQALVRDPRVAQLLETTYTRLTATSSTPPMPGQPPSLSGPSAASTPWGWESAALAPWGARELANVVHGVCVALCLPESGEREASRLFDACCHRSVGLLNTFKPQELSNFVWALGKATHHAPVLLEAAAKVATRWLLDEAAVSAAATTEAAHEPQPKRQKPSAASAASSSAAASGSSAAPVPLSLAWVGAAHSDVSAPALVHDPVATSMATSTAASTAPHTLPAAAAADAPPATASTYVAYAPLVPSASNGTAAPPSWALDSTPSNEPSLVASYEPDDGEDGGGTGGSAQGGTEGVGRGFSPQELSNILYSYGRAAHPAPDLFAAVAAPLTDAWERGQPTLVGWSVQDVANTLWACAAADARHGALVAACETALFTRGFVLHQAHFTQLQQWLIWWEIELKRTAPLVNASVREQCRDAMAKGDQTAGHTVSAFQKAVGRGLERLGVRFSDEVTTREGYSIDIAVLPENIAIEVDGPTHFTQKHTPTGATALKRRQLCATGWHVVAIPYFEWYELDRNVPRENEYLRRLLEPFVSSSVSSSASQPPQQQPYAAPPPQQQPYAAPPPQQQYSALPTPQLYQQHQQHQQFQNQRQHQQYQQHRQQGTIPGKQQQQRYMYTAPPPQQQCSTSPQEQHLAQQHFAQQQRAVVAGAFEDPLLAPPHYQPPYHDPRLDPWM